MQRCNVIAESAVYAALLLGFAGAGVAHPQAQTGGEASRPKGDPNLPVTGGDFGVANVNEDNIGRVMFHYDDPDLVNNPSVEFEYGGRTRAPMKYLGYNEDGSWLLDRGRLFTLKGRVVTNRHMGLAQMPRGLKNTSPFYVATLARQEGSPEKPSGSQVPSIPAALGGASGANAGEASSTKGDPNLPLTGGDFGVASLNEDKINRVVFFYDNPELLNNPTVKFQYGGGNIFPMEYLGYNEEGSWLVDRGRLFTLKGRVVTNRHMALAQMPTGLRNGSTSYLATLARREGSPETVAGKPVPSVPANSTGAGGSNGRQGSAAQTSPSGLQGTDARIERRDGGATLTYKDGAGKAQSYRVARPRMGVPPEAARQLDATDAGAWLYQSEDGKSGILFTVKADGTLTTLPLAGPMIARLAGRGN